MRIKVPIIHETVTVVAKQMQQTLVSLSMRIKVPIIHETVTVVAKQMQQTLVSLSDEDQSSYHP